MSMLNDAKIRAAKARAKPYKLTDSHRLYLLVTPTGSKLWKWGYRYGEKQKTMSFGIYPGVGLLDARSKRDEARRQLDEGHDPAVVKRLKVAANLEAGRTTFELVARDWHATFKTQWAVRHAADILRSLEHDVFPSIGSLPIASLTPPAIFDLLKAMEDRGAGESAKRVRQRISAIFGYAMAVGKAECDPAEKLGAALKPVRKGRQPAIVELGPLQKMINDAEEDYARPVTRLALRLLALTAVRPGELRGARWEEFEDLDGKYPLWRIPAARMKGGIERKEEDGGDHLVPLAPQSVEVLCALWPLTGDGELLFPGNRFAHRPMSENAIGYLLNRAGYHGHHVPHGFRAAFSTIMNEWAKREGDRDDRSAIDLMLAHIPKQVSESEGAYNRAAYMPRRRELACIWADMLTEKLPAPRVLVERPAKPLAEDSRRRVPEAVPKGFRFSNNSAGRAV
ncbi:integrase arm-type DNA-binding domain-containing protein [Sphingopyxis sp. KK2]|uniref:tyrosine-type recombinase/integrase n=1 Tax=Sphingopyxis sp. KK2 TaxID=1855727 RepID=UPI002117ED2B|nr:integrase arm-type DNA-binding domain-containing protein [Sphingopyxis sp. KK2]